MIAINMGSIKHKVVKTNGVRLHVAFSGSSDKPLAILLHGFPEFWISWRKAVIPLVKAGYRVLIPDQRGYNISDKPRGISEYSIDKLTSDVIGLIDTEEKERAFLVGHDWGASVAWHAALTKPERLSRLVILNVPHPVVMNRFVRSNRNGQIKKSWYILLFQVPWLPESLVRLSHWSLAVQSMKGSSLPGMFSKGDFNEYRKAWSQPGSMRSMINWYRAALQQAVPLKGNYLVKVPTLIIWGVKDRFLDHQMAVESLKLCDNGKLIYFPDVTHWVHHEKPDKVHDLIIKFFQGIDINKDNTFDLFKKV